MSYPTLEQYQEALQFPQTAFIDPQLKSGRIRASGLGLPSVVCGGFALTYAVETGHTKYAVRCFHREAPALEKRYASISKKLKTLASPYFVDFEFQPHGVNLNGSTYPLVRMAWAVGETLGEFVEANHGDKAKLTNLVNSLSQLSAYLEAQGIAHGDIQEGNLMVADAGRRIQLIDYDGMFVPEIAALGSSEMGHRDYQHPGRDGSQFDTSLDRFSFMGLNLALRALCEKPSLWSSSGSGAGVIVFKANDYADPGSSSVLAAVAQIPSLGRDARSFAAICGAPYRKLPSFEDFLNARNIPLEGIVLDGKPKAVQIPVGYISQYPVLDASSYGVFASHIGQMVELVGRVVEVKHDIGKFGKGKGKPYVFVNFAPWNGPCVKINLWNEALAKGGVVPTADWVGRWITIKGLVEPIYRSPKYKYQHISITAATLSQITQLTDAEARFRLKGPGARKPAGLSNSSLLGQIKGGGGAPQRPAPSATPLSANQQVLQKMRQQTQPVPGQGSSAGKGLPQRPVPGPLASQHAPAPQKKRSGIPWWIWAVGLVILYVLLKR